MNSKSLLSLILNNNSNNVTSLLPKRKFKMAAIPLTRIVFLNNILPYVTRSKEIVKMRLVNKSWNECVMVFSEDLWKEIFWSEIDDYGNTRLHKCLFSINIDPWVDFFLQYINVDIENKHGYTPLFLAGSNDDRVNFELFLSKGANTDKYYKCYKDPSQNPYTLLHNLCYFGNTHFVKLLIDAGANIEAKDCLGNTPLHFACRIGNIECVKLLVNAGAEIEVKDHFNKTPIDVASIEAKDHFYKTSIMASRYCHTECVEFLLSVLSQKRIKN